jgi:hypothetical protein
MIMPFALTTQRHSNRWLACRILVGCFLLVAAGLKAYGLTVEPFARYGWFIGPRTRTAALIWEFVLAAWLLSGQWRSAAWSFSVLTFLAFASVSGYLGWIGRASCGCFGTLQVSPWLVASLDGVFLVLLLVCRPPAEASTRRRAGGRFVRTRQPEWSPALSYHRRFSARQSGWADHLNY